MVSPARVVSSCSTSTCVMNARRRSEVRRPTTLVADVRRSRCRVVGLASVRKRAKWPREMVGVG